MQLLIAQFRVGGGQAFKIFWCSRATREARSESPEAIASNDLAVAFRGFHQVYAFNDGA